MAKKDDREIEASEVAIIREVYDNEHSPDAFGEELDRALENGFRIIIVEPTRLGDETSRWIAVGNFLHKSAAISGVAAIIAAGILWPKKPITYAPLGIFSFLCTGVYMVSWQTDPCCQYQVNRSAELLAKMPVYGVLTSSSPVVLVRKSDFRRRILHSAVTLTSTVFCLWRLYVVYK
ncbi:transmembrane protein 11-A, mitochondrial [Nilaparvata lugens]|uniref:transmembrane protein 11-A, mitochondrial n=1 Tax=Nilaparvata lugens TaxID=108931 RepID=UPI00193DBE05|nr:transmembrane protein 11-A, mitochondrial [Nilaparvata lugens]